MENLPDDSYELTGFKEAYSIIGTIIIGTIAAGVIIAWVIG